MTDFERLVDQLQGLGLPHTAAPDRSAVCWRTSEPPQVTMRAHFDADGKLIGVDRVDYELLDPRPSDA